MRLLIGLIVVCIHTSLFAQSQINITSSNQAIMLYNPAYAGAEDHINVAVLYKSQWVNQPGNPVAKGVTANMPINYERIGIGLNVWSESAGVVQSLYLNSNFSYKINFHRGRLAFGMRLGLLQRTENVSSLLVKDQGDGLISDQRTLNPEFGGGLYYKEKKYYIGMSFYRSAGIYLDQYAALKNYYMLIAGCNLRVNSNMVLKPFTMVRYTQAFTPYAALMLPLEYQEILSFGVGYSSASVLSVQASMHIDQLLSLSENKYTLTYAYDQSLNKFNNYIGNTHEIILSIRLIPAEKLDRIIKRKVTVSPLKFD